MSMAMQAAIAATAQPSDHLDRVVQSVTDATKRLSQISTSTTNTTTKSSKRRSRDTIGPWKLGKTLGKGSSGRVRLAKNMETGKLAAIKIVPKTKSSSRPNSLPYGIEREIIIMKLISHPNVMGLYEVWENKLELFLVLEYVDGGELFDYLVSRGRLPEREAIHYFKQIIEGVAYCHSFNICHRDLKPENLLLDKKNRRIKIADFGMAALQTSNKLLETSCGSPHYASPEIVMGKTYNGGPSDIWSCGIVLFALLTGHLPFNDDNVKRLLLKVQSGRYQLPSNMSAEARDLISKILIVDPSKRISIQGILSHPLITKYDTKRSKSNSNLHLLNNSAAQIVTLESKQDVDPTILQNLQILWHGAPKEFIIRRLLQPDFTEEKMFYSLLLAYQQRQSNQNQKQKEPSVNAPKVIQKSQFSVPSIRSQYSPKKEHVASSSRVFKSNSNRFIHSASKRSLHSSTSKRSLRSSASKKSLRVSPEKSLISKSSNTPTMHPPQPAEPLESSKRSLYSLKSISKRSVNLKDYLNDESSSIPPLPTQSEFEMLCEQILFGGGLSGIKEEGPEENEISNDFNYNTSQDDSNDSRIETQTSVDTITAPVINKTQSHSPGKAPEPDTYPLPRRPVEKTADQKQRIVSAPTSKEKPISLDPRRNVSQPNSIEMLLAKYSLRTHLRSKSNLKKLRNSGDWSIEKDFDFGSSENAVQPVAESTMEANTSTALNHGLLTSVLAQSSTIESTSSHASRQESSSFEPLLSLPSSTLNSSMTFKNLSQFLSENAVQPRRTASVAHSTDPKSETLTLAPVRKQSKKQTLAPRTSLNVPASRKPSQVSTDARSENRSEYFSDMSFALEIPTHTFTAQAVQISNGSSLEQLEIPKHVETMHAEPVEEEINIFEDAPGDTASVATSSSGVDSQLQAHRKATSIDTLNTTNLLTTSPTDVRVSLYANNIASSIGLPRETTEEIISKFKLSPEKGMQMPQKRFSYQQGKIPLSQSMISLFKDLDDEQDEIENNSTKPGGTQHGLDNFQETTTNEEPTQGEPRAAENKKPELEGKKRVTMLFDDDTENVFKASPIKRPPAPATTATPKVSTSKASAPAPFRKSKLTTVVECEHSPPPKPQRAPVQMAKPVSTGGNWFTKLMRTLAPRSNRGPALTRDHVTSLPFEEAHLVVLREFGNNAVDYELKRLDRRGTHSRAEYACQFVQGRFRFKIRIEGDTRSANIHVKKRGGNVDADAFQRFNNDIAKVLRKAQC